MSGSVEGLTVRRVSSSWLSEGLCLVDITIYSILSSLLINIFILMSFTIVIRIRRARDFRERPPRGREKRGVSRARSYWLYEDLSRRCPKDGYGNPFAHLLRHSVENKRDPQSVGGSERDTRLLL